MNKLNKMLSIILAVITIFLAVCLKDFKLLLFLIYIALLYIIKMNQSLKFVALTFGFLGGFLGFLLHLYKVTTWYDTFIHFISGIFVGLVAIYILNKFKLYDKNNILFNTLFIILFSLSVSALWEVIEFILDKIFNSDMQRKLTGVNDTMKDIICALLGNILFNITFYFEYKYKNKILIHKFVDNMTGGSYGRENFRTIKTTR